MSFSIQIGNQTITPDNVMPRLARYQLLPQLIREAILDQAIADITCSPEESQAAIQQFCQQQKISSEAELGTWLQSRGIAPELFESIAQRPLKLEKFKQQIFGNKLESYFLKRKSALDQVIYSLIRTKDMGMAQELYFRLEDDQSSFAQLARDHSQGPEAETGGLVGPVELEIPHPSMARMLSISQPGQLWPPTRIGEWMIIVRLEKFMPAQLNQSTQNRLLQELFQQWLQEQLKTVSIETGLEAKV
jgi:parvulin-like peptidyl-prolyl isomerase